MKKKEGKKEKMAEARNTPSFPCQQFSCYFLHSFLEHMDSRHASLEEGEKRRKEREKIFPKESNEIHSLPGKAVPDTLSIFSNNSFITYHSHAKGNKRKGKKRKRKKKRKREGNRGGRYFYLLPKQQARRNSQGC